MAKVNQPNISILLLKHSQNGLEKKRKEFHHGNRRLTQSQRTCCRSKGVLYLDFNTMPLGELLEKYEKFLAKMNYSSENDGEN